jgi:hypothetical protein
MLHPDKTRFVDFRNTVSNGTTHPERSGPSMSHELVWFHISRSQDVTAITFWRIPHCLCVQLP